MHGDLFEGGQHTRAVTLPSRPNVERKLSALIKYASASRVSTTSLQCQLGALDEPAKVRGLCAVTAADTLLCCDTAARRYLCSCIKVDLALLCSFSK